MFAICEEGRLWYNGYNPGGCPWVEFSALPEIEDPAGPADHSRGATKMVATDDEIERLKRIIKAKDAQIRQAYGYGNDAGSPPWMQ
jgi:hypothetical protein